MKYIITLTLLLILSSCGDSPSQAAQRAAKFQHDLQHPQFLGTTPSGDNVYFVIRETGSYPHYIYFTGKTITVNDSVPQGKFTTNRATVIINGEEFVKKDSVK